MVARSAKTIGWLATGVWAAAIFAVSSVPGSQLPGGYSVPAHFVEYAVLGGLLCFSLHFSQPSARALMLAILLASLYGITDELHQAFVPLRNPDPLDWLVDTAGAAMGAVVVYGALGLRRRVRERRAGALGR
jgi:VanZ family protein